MAALAKVGNILVPALVIIYVYSVVGLYTFAGNLPSIQTSNTTGVDSHRMHWLPPTGLSTPKKSSFVGKSPARCTMATSMNA